MNEPHRSDTFPVLTVVEDGVERKEHLKIQHIKNRYLDIERLKTFLEKRFPSRWKLQVGLILPHRECMQERN